MKNENIIQLKYQEKLLNYLLSFGDDEYYSGSKDFLFVGAEDGDHYAAARFILFSLIDDEGDYYFSSSNLLNEGFKHFLPITLREDHSKPTLFLHKRIINYTFFNKLFSKIIECIKPCASIFGHSNLSAYFIKNISDVIDEPEFVHILSFSKHSQHYPTIYYEITLNENLEVIDMVIIDLFFKEAIKDLSFELKLKAFKFMLFFTTNYEFFKQIDISYDKLDFKNTEHYYTLLEIYEI